MGNYSIVAVGGEVEVTGDSVNLECSLHPTSLLLLYVFDYSLKNLLVIHSLDKIVTTCIWVSLIFRETDFNEVILNVDEMDFKDILDI